MDESQRHYKQSNQYSKAVQSITLYIRHSQKEKKHSYGEQIRDCQRLGSGYVCVVCVSVFVYHSKGIA